jgi:leucyl aminopeptidase (aminopeptidase T)
MTNIFAARGARTIVEKCAFIKEGEKVFIVTDYDTFPEADLIAQHAIAIGANVTIGIMSQRDLDGQEPEGTIAAAMKQANVVLMPVRKSLAHTNASRIAREAGARILSLTASSMDLLASPAYMADFKKAAPLCEKFSDIFSKGDTLTITSKAGTNFSTSMRDRKGNAHKCLVDKPGQFSAAPNIEANFSPVEGTSNGVFVADASIPYLGIGALDSPVTFVIKDGAVVEVKGGSGAKKIAKIWKEKNDPNVYNIAQIAVGLNPEVPEAIGYLGCNYDEGAFGTMHIGIGTSTNLGGTVKATTHFDAVMSRPTLAVDGKTLIEDGVVLVK